MSLGAELSTDPAHAYAGTYGSEIDAARMFDELAFNYLGRCAALNFPRPDGLVPSGDTSDSETDSDAETALKAEQMTMRATSTSNVTITSALDNLSDSLTSWAPSIGYLEIDDAALRQIPNLIHSKASPSALGCFDRHSTTHLMGHLVAGGNADCVIESDDLARDSSQIEAGYPAAHVMVHTAEQYYLAHVFGGNFGTVNGTGQQGSNDVLSLDFPVYGGPGLVVTFQMACVFAAGRIVVVDPAASRVGMGEPRWCAQQFFRGHHNGPITCLTSTDNGKLMVSACRGAAESLHQQACVCVWYVVRVFK